MTLTVTDAPTVVFGVVYWWSFLDAVPVGKDGWFCGFLHSFLLKTAGNSLFSRLLGAEPSSISKQKRMCTHSHSRASSAQEDFYTVTAVQHIDWHLHVRPWFNTCTLRCISNHYKVYSWLHLGTKMSSIQMRVLVSTRFFVWFSSPSSVGWPLWS